MRSFQEGEIEFELAVANDYDRSVEPPGQLQDEPVFLLVERAHGNVSDGSNLRFVRFDYGLPTGRDIIGVNFNIEDANGFNLRSEWVMSRAFFPNRNFQRHRVAQDKGIAYYLTASQDAYPYFA